MGSQFSVKAGLPLAEIPVTASDPCSNTELWGSRVGKLTVNTFICHYNDVIMGAMASQITGLTIVYSAVNSGADQRKYRRSASLAFGRGINRWPVNSPRKGLVTRKMFPFHDVIMAINRYISIVLTNIYNPLSILFCKILMTSKKYNNPTNAYRNIIFRPVN